MLAHVSVYLKTKIVAWAHFRHWLMINLEGLNTLDEIRGVPVEVDHIANMKDTRVQAQGRD